MNLTLLDIIKCVLSMDVGWFLIGLASVLWCYGVGRQMYTQEGFWDDDDDENSQHNIRVRNHKALSILKFNISNFGPENL